MAVKDDLDTTLAFRPHFNGDGLIVVAATDVTTGALLMIAYMNKEALSKTIETGEAHYWSRSRRELWRKGATSGHTQSVKEIRVDCDQDAIQLVIDQKGSACHTGETSCFYRLVTNEDGQRKLTRR